MNYMCEGLTEQIELDVYILCAVLQRYGKWFNQMSMSDSISYKYFVNWTEIVLIRVVINALTQPSN